MLEQKKPRPNNVNESWGMKFPVETIVFTYRGFSIYLSSIPIEGGKKFRQFRHGLPYHPS